MSMRYIFALFAGALLAAWLIPARQASESSAAAPALQTQVQAMPPAADIEQPADDAADSEGIILTRQADGHFYANAEVNGGAVRFMVDTGASAIALTRTDAEELGLEWDDNDLQMVGRGVNGDVYGKPVLLKTVRVGEIVAHDVQAAIIPEGLDVSLLGQSFLSKVGNVNIRGDQMTFE